MSNPLISVIIPAYNAEETIQKSIESISNQEDIEIVVVVDGAKDKTEEVCRNLQTKFTNLKIFVQENQGQYIARKNGIEKAKVLEVIDHHRICNFETPEPLYYTAKPYGCTSTILYGEFKARKIEIEKKEATLMASAIISDTLLLKSPTTTQYDKEALQELSKIAEINLETYGLEMLKAGTDLDEFSEEELLNLDAKKFEKDGVKCVIAQVNTVSIEEVLEREEKLKEAMNAEIEKEGLDVCILAITDILNSDSELIVLGNRTDVIEKSHHLENDKVFLKGVVSRKKQLLPMVENNI